MTRKEKIQFLKRLVTGKANLDEISPLNIRIQIANGGTRFYNQRTMKELTNSERERLRESVRKTKNVKINVSIV